MSTFLQNVFASCVALLLLIAIAMFIYQIFAFRRIKERRESLKNVHENLAPGKEIMFAGGLLGKVHRISGDVVEVKIKSGEILEVSRYAIQNILS